MKKAKTIKELAKFLGKSEATIYNWKKDNPNLYEVVTSYINPNDEIEEKSIDSEIIKLIEKLPKNKKKKFYYLIMAELAEMKH